MKKLLYILPLVMFAMTSCDWFELDNMDGHNAQVEGKFIDSKTGDVVYAGMAAQVISSWHRSMCFQFEPIRRVNDETGFRIHC